MSEVAGRRPGSAVSPSGEVGARDAAAEIDAERERSRRELKAEQIACRLDGPLTFAGVVVILVVMADNLTPADSPLKPVWFVAGWGLWALFLFEYLVRLVMAPDTAGFLRRTWWQLLFLAVPFLRFLRAFTRPARIARFARVASTSVRTTRTAGLRLAGRLGWLAGIAVSTILAASEVLYEYGPAVSYPEALHAVALAAIAAHQIEVPGAVAAVIELLLALHASVVFAALAGSIGAFLLERGQLSVPDPHA